MKVIIERDYTAQCHIAADMIEKIVRESPDCRLGLATGSSPIGMYQELIRRCREEGLDFSQVCTVNLDEYVGLSPDHEQSYRYFMDTNFFDHINIDKKNTHVPSGVGDMEENLRQYKATLRGGTTAIQVLGLGADGHIGFNEPGDSLRGETHLEELDPSTIEANSRFFADASLVPRRAITMGVGDIMQAEKLLLIISGSNKEEAAARLLMSDEVTPRCPATLLKLHRDATVIITQALADKIGYKA